MKQPGERDIADLFHCYLWDASVEGELDYISDETLDRWEAVMREFCERENIHYYVRQDGTERRA